MPRIVCQQKRFGSDRDDWHIFCQCAMDFYTGQLSEELDRKSFQSVFAACVTRSSQYDTVTPYRMLLAHIAVIDGAHGILQ